jgi:predicted PurR-regulated permease PerM
MSEQEGPPAVGSSDVGAPGESAPSAQPVVTRRGRVALASGGWGWLRRFARLWGFLGFSILVLILTRQVILPFVFALLLAYILAPAVRRLSASEGGLGLPRGLAIILCYLVLLGGIALFFGALLPRLSKDAARIGREAPALYKRVNDEWAPRVAAWLEAKFPSFAPPSEPLTAPPAVSDVPLPPGTQLVVTPLPDGRLAIQLEPAGLEVRRKSGDTIAVTPSSEAREAVRVEDRLRELVRSWMTGMQSQVGGLFRWGQAIVGGVVRSIFTFFLVLMVGGFILLDLERIHSFVRGLIPAAHRDDYDVIVAGVDRGLSGVIRGQLIICLVNGLLTYVGLIIFDIKYALILAVVAAVLSLIPIFGSILSTLPIVVAALVSDDAGIDVMRALFIVGWIIGIHFLEANLLNPKIIGSAAKIHPVLVIFALIVGEHSYGLVGALLAVPVASIVQTLFLFFRKKAWRNEPSLLVRS